MTRFKITDEKLRKFVEEAQDLLDTEPGSHLTLHRIADDRSEKKIARYDNDKDWADSWLEDVVSDLLKTDGHARLRLRRWLKGGVGRGSCAFEAGEASAPVAAATLRPLPIQTATAQAPPPVEAPPPVRPMADARLAVLEAQLSQVSMTVSRLQSQPPDHRLMMSVEQAVAMAQEAKGAAEKAQTRLEQGGTSLQNAQTAVDVLKAENATLKAEGKVAQERLDLLEEKLVMVHGMVEACAHAINMLANR